MIWTAALGVEACGACEMPFAVDDPLAQLTAQKLIRCEHCAGAPVDRLAVEAVKAQRKAEKAAREANAGIMRKGGEPVLPGFTTIAAPDPGPRSPRLPAVRQPLPFAAVADSLPASSDHD